MNNISLVGRLTKDVEIKTFGDKQVGKFTLAVNHPFKKGETDFFNCDVWGKSAEILEQYVKKGQQLAVEGSIHITKSDDKYFTNVSVRSFTFIGNKGDAVKTKSDDFDLSEDISDDDLPF